MPSLDAAAPAFSPPVALRATALLPAARSRPRAPAAAPAEPRRAAAAPRAAAFRLSGAPPPRASRWSAEVAAARAITPMRRPGGGDGAAQQQQQQARQDPQQYATEEPVLPSGRRSDLMAPARTGVWALVPYVAACVVVGAAGWAAAKRLAARQAGLVDDFGEVMVYYGNGGEAMREICADYKGRLGPGVLRGAMLRSYLRNLVTEKAVGPDVINDVSAVVGLLGVRPPKAVAVFNALGADLKESPSLLGKLMFVAERSLSPDAAAGLDLLPLFPYGEATVVELQRNMVDRCFRDLVGRSLDADASAALDVAAAGVLRIPVPDAERMYNEVVLARVRAAEDARAATAAAESEDASKPQIADLDYPARSGEPAKAAVHAFQCSQCGYTMFPAAGREFKFFGAEFVCPTCGAPKDKFVDLNAED